MLNYFKAYFSVKLHKIHIKYKDEEREEILYYKEKCFIKIFHGIAVCALMVGIACDPELLALVTFAILIMFIWIAFYSGYQVIKMDI